MNTADAELLRERFKTHSDEHLAEVAHNADNEYTDAAIEVACEILRERGLTPPKRYVPSMEELHTAHRALMKSSSDARWTGALLFGGGLLATIAPLLGVGNGRAVIWYGAMAVGAVQFFRGESMRHKALELQQTLQKRGFIPPP